MKIFSAFFTLPAIVAAFALFAAAPHTTTVNIVATTWKFTPSTITLKVNQPTTLRLTSTNGTHGLQSDDVGIPLTLIPPGKVELVTVTPKKTGVFVLHCANFCGTGHATMAMTVKVVR